MAYSDLQKFKDLLISDAGFQEKFRKAADSYTGPQDMKAVFDNMLAPLGKEYGLSTTYEEFQKYMDSFSGAKGELSEAELSQVAGGKDNGSNAAVASIVMADSMAGIHCKGIGFAD